MKKIIILVVLGLVAAGTLDVQAANNKDDGYEAIVASWIEERDETVTGIVYGYFRGATSESQKKAFGRLVELDVKLANENVPLYVTGLKEASNFDACIRDVVMLYLKRNGIAFNTADFFAGNTYEIIRRK